MKKKTAIALVIALVVLIGVFAYVYVESDLFKTNRELFNNYLINKNIKAMSQLNVEPYKKLSVEGKSYSFLGNASSDTINETLNLEKNLYFNINMASDIKTNKSSASYMIKAGEENILGLEYLRNAEKIGIKFDEVTEQKYMFFENNNLKELATKLGVTDTSNVPNKIELLSQTNDNKINIRELREIQKKYSDIINSLIPEDKYTVEKNVILKINDEDKKVNKYSLKITEKELYNIITNCLTNLIDDVETLEFYVKYFDKDATVKELSEGVASLKESFVESEENYLETDNILISVYSYKGKNVKTEITTATGNTISMYITSKENNDEIKIEFFQAKNEELNVFIGNTTSIILTNSANNDKIDLKLMLKQTYNVEDMASLQPSENLYIEDSNLELNLIINDISSDCAKVSGEGKYNDNNIFKFEGELNKGGEHQILDLNTENSIDIKSYSEEELKNKISGIEDETISVFLDKAEKVVPGSTLILSNYLSGLGLGVGNAYVADLQDVIGDGVTAEVNRALITCIDNYAVAFLYDNTASLGTYLTEENVKAYCTDAKEIKFTDTGIRYTGKDGKVYEGVIDTTLETGYIYVEEMIEKK